ncbi:MAG: hypothetical protein ACHQ53_17835 [Polyangiales bacterium]
MQPSELIARAQALPWPAPIQRAAKRALRALAKRSKTAAWLLDHAQAPVVIPARQPAASPSALPHRRSLDALAYAMRSVSAETCVAAIAELTDRGDAAAGALLLDLLEDCSGFFISITRLAAARGLQRVADVDAARVDRVLALEGDVAVADALRTVSAAAAPARRL